MGIFMQKGSVMILFAILDSNGVVINKEKPKVNSFIRSVDAKGNPSLLFSLVNGTAEEVTDIIGEYRDASCQVFKTETSSYIFTP